MTTIYSVYEQAPTVLNSNSNSVDIDVSFVGQLFFGANVSAINGATTLNLFIDVKGGDGVYYQVWASSNITATGATNQSLGPGLQTAVSLGEVIRIRWTITASQAATVSFTLLGR